jgi:transcriptional regulator with XRE-family HTH domain
MTTDHASARPTPGEIGALLRRARTTAGLSLEEAGQLIGYSAATLSRWENGHRRGWTITELLRLAEAYGIPPNQLGLAASSPPFGSSPDMVSAGSDNGGGDWMRRRDLLAGAIGVTTGAAVGSPAHADAEAPATIEDVIFGRVTAQPLPDQQLTAQIAAARADFRACRYSQASRRLPRLLAQAEAARRQAGPIDASGASTRLAQTYCVATQLLLKLHDDGLACATADRAVHAADAGGDPVVAAESGGLAAKVLRRAGHPDGAQRLIMDVAQRLNSDTRLFESRQAAKYGELLAIAAYTAATRDDRDSAWTLLTEADDAVGRAGAGADNPLTQFDLAVYKISVARTLGDFGSAVDYARRVDASQITSPERRTRYWQDTALALHGRGRLDSAYRVLLMAERDTPQDVRYRPWAQRLTQDLLTRDSRGVLPGIRDFAGRIGIA